MNENNQPKKIINIETEDILSTIDGIPLPPGIKKNLWKSIGRLITGVVDIPVAYLESKTERIKRETIALNIFRNKVIEKASDEFLEDENLMKRTVNYYGSKLLKEQINREKVIDKTIEELKLNPPKNNVNKEVDEDWLDMFSRISETKSNEEVQLILSKILSGEIKNPGSFSPKSLQILTILDQRTAKIFQDFCSISFSSNGLGDTFTCLICEPFGAPGGNSLLEFNLNYRNLAELQDAGLIQYDLNAWKEIPPVVFVVPFNLGNKTFNFEQTSELLQKPIKSKIINFTRVGLELREVLQMETNESYNEKTIEWIKKNFNLV